MRSGVTPARGQELIERERELAEIDEALGGALAGEGWLALFEGPAGIGKTALLEAARDRADLMGVAVIAGRGGELEGSFPYGIVRQLLEPVARAAGMEQRARLFAGAAALAAPVVLGPEAGRAPGAPTFEAVHGLYWLVANLATESPVALVVDDLQWSDAASLRFLAYLARRLDGLAATMIASVRTGEGSSDRDLVTMLQGSPGARLAAPEALSDAGVATVLASEFGQAPDAGFARTCHEVTGGNPFLVRELASALTADRIAPTADAIQRLSATGPKTIARVTLARLGHLSDQAVELARAVAVLGGDARLPRAAAVAGLDGPQALVALDALVAEDVVPASGRLEFKHPVVRTAIYEELAPGVLSAAHRQIADLLVAEGAGLDAIAGHLLLTQPIGSPQTIVTLREAASHALALGAPHSAAAYLSRALEEGCERQLRITLLLDLAFAEKLARRPGVIGYLEEVRRLTEDPVIRATAMIEQAETVAFAGDWSASLQLVDDAIGELGGREPAIALRAETLRGPMAAYDPRLVAGFEQRLPALRRIAADGVAGSRPLVMLLAGFGVQHGEPLDRGRALVERGWDDGRYLAEGDSIEMLPQGIGALVMVDDLDRAGEIVGAVRDSARARGSVMEFLIAGAHEAWIEARRGNLGVAAAEMRGVFERAMEHGVQFAVLMTLWYCSDVLLERPDAADLASLAETVELGPMSDLMAGALVLEVRGRLRFAAGEIPSAIADLRRAGATSVALGFVNPNGFSSWRAHLALMLPRQQRDEALELVTGELADARRIGLARGVGVALRVLGMLVGGADGRSHLEEAASVLADSPARLEHARALVELGAALRRDRDRIAARGALRDGLELAARCGAVRLAERAQTELAATGARPRRLYASGRDSLTPSELRVAQMAAEGRTSQDIAQALFVTTKTIDAHLNHTYAKLGINSRKQLAAALGHAG